MTSPITTSPLSAPDWQHLQPLLDRLTPQQLNWLSAWCRERAAAAPSAAEREPADILLIAASQTGNATVCGGIPSGSVVQCAAGGASGECR